MKKLSIWEDVSIAQCPPKNVSNLEIIMDEDIQVSLFENVKANKPINTVNLFDWLEDPMHQKNIAYLRNQPTEEDRKKSKRYASMYNCKWNFFNKEVRWANPT